MPKKFATENTKAVEARERKKQSKEQDAAKKQKAADDAYWQDDNKQAQKKMQKKEELEKKKAETLAKKAEAKALLEQEVSSIKVAKPAPPARVTRAQINHNKTVITKEQKTQEVTTHLDLDAPLEENINRLQIDGEEARSVTEAISVLSSKPDDVDKHPEKRMKALHTAFEERRLRELKEEGCSLRLSQQKQLIFKEWQKSPENPLNKLG